MNILYVEIIWLNLSNIYVKYFFNFFAIIELFRSSGNFGLSGKK